MGDGMLAPRRGRGELGVGRRPSRSGSALVSALGLRFERARDADGVERGSDTRRPAAAPRAPLRASAAPAIDVGDSGIVACDLALERGDPFAQLRDPGRAPRLARGGADVLGLVLGAATAQRPEDEAPVDADPGPGLALAEAEAGQQARDRLDRHRLIRHRLEHVDQRAARPPAGRPRTPRRRARGPRCRRSA